MEIEVCVDNHESLLTACKAGADRIELCSSLELGGLTPSIGFAIAAVVDSAVPVYAMIRPRAGDFVYSDEEINIMINDIYLFKSIGVDGVVFGVLNEDSTVNTKALLKLVTAANGIGVTFHRAFDLVDNPFDSIFLLIEYGCDRVLTSGLNATAIEGVELISELNKIAGAKIKIMAGAGVSHVNALDIVNITGVSEIHLSGKRLRPSKMNSSKGVKMGKHCDSDANISITCYDKIKQVVDLF